jgi:predicted dehydrogenase
LASIGEGIFVNFGLIGCGYWGPNYIRVIYELVDQNVKWIADSDETKIKTIREKYPLINTASDYNEILQDADVDAVIISTPTTTHFKIAKDCLLAGKHVLVEKPLTTTSEEALELKKIAETENRILMVGYIFKYHSAIHKMKDDIINGTLGDILYCYSSRTGLGPIRKDVNVVWDLASHDISILLHLFDKKPISVVAHGKSYIQKDVEDVAFIVLNYADGMIANLHVSWLDPIKIRKTVLVGTKKMLIFDDISPSEKIRILDKGVSYEKPFGNYGDFSLRVRDGDIVIPQINMKEPLREEVLHFISCIKDNKKPITDADDAFMTTKVLEAVQKSLKTGNQKVRIDWEE